jgi:hypothetical protein
MEELLIGFRYEVATDSSETMRFCVTDSADSEALAAVKITDANLDAAPGIIYEAFNGEYFSVAPYTEDPHRLEIRDLREG